jgi:general secretion pathway protein N
LVGTISSGDESFGIFIDQASRAALRLKLGEDFQGWRLRAVQGRDVILERDHETTTLSLPQPGTSTTAAPATSSLPTAGLRAQADDEVPSANTPRRANRHQ